MEKERRSGGSGIVFLTVVGILSQFLGFGYRVAMSRMVGAEVMGLYQLLMSAYAVLQSLTLTGMTAAVSNLTSQYLARHNSRGAAQVLSCAIGLFFLLLLPAAAGVVLFSDGISVHLLGDARTRLGLVLLLPCAALTGIENLHKHHFYGAGRVCLPGGVDLAEQCIRAAAVLTLLWVFLPQYPERAAGLIVLGMWVSEIFSSLTLMVLTRRWRRQERPAGPGESARICRKKIADIAIPVGTTALLGNLIGAANAALIPQKLAEGGMAPSEALGKFGVVCGMTMPMLAVPTVFLGAISLTLTPRLARAGALGDREKIRRLSDRAVTLTAVLTLPAMGLMAAVGDELGRVLFRQGGVGEFLVPLAGVMALCCYESVLNSILSGVGQQRAVAVISLLSGGAQLCITLGTVAQIGMAGYVLGAAAASTLGLVLSGVWTMRSTGAHIRWMDWVIIPGLSALLAGLNARLLLRVLLDSGASTLAAILGAIVFGLWVYTAAIQAQGMEVKGRGKSGLVFKTLREEWGMKGKRLAVCLAVPLGVGGLSWLLTRQGMEIVRSAIVYPPMTPPQWVFPMVWTVLYLMMGTASFLVWRSQARGCTAGAPLELYGVQLASGLLWTVVFFSGRRYALAFFWLVLYWLLAFFTALSFAKRSRAAGWLMVPYLLWLTFAGYLNFAVWRMN